METKSTLPRTICRHWTENLTGNSRMIFSMYFGASLPVFTTNLMAFTEQQGTASSLKTDY